jgi:hypothetical protein
MRDSILKVLKDDSYRIGDYQALLYDRRREDVFPPGYLLKLWELCRTSGRGKLGILPTLFCGMRDLSADALTSYLAGRPVVVMVVWTGPNTFLEAGFAFPSTLPMTGLPVGPERAMFGGFGMFQGVWGLEAAEILGMLTLSYLFLEFDVSAIHGLRYPENALAGRFMRRYGAKDNGMIPRFMLRGDELTGAISSTLMVEDFEHYVERKLVDLLNSGGLNNGRQESESRTIAPSNTGNGEQPDGAGAARPRPSC